MPKYRYYVETTEDIVLEMARYDTAAIESAEFVRLGTLNPITDEQEARDKCISIGFEPHNKLIYRWVLVSQYPPTVERWASFMVQVHML
jgi:hypothetical protein